MSKQKKLLQTHVKKNFKDLGQVMTRSFKFQDGVLRVTKPGKTPKKHELQMIQDAVKLKDTFCLKNKKCVTIWTA